MFKEFMSGFRYLQQAVIFYIFIQISGDEGLTYNSRPFLFIFTLSATENLQLILIVRQYFRGLFSHQHVDDVIGFEFFFKSYYGI